MPVMLIDHNLVNKILWETVSKALLISIDNIGLQGTVYNVVSENQHLL